MALQIEKQDNSPNYVIKVSGEVDLYSSPDLRKAIQKSPIREKGTLAIDLSAISYMDSSGVATLVEGLRNCNKSKMGFVLLAPSSPVMKVLQLSRLDSVFDIRDTL